MSREDVYFHEEWLGMARPEGLVVSLPVLVEAQCAERQPAATQHRLRELCPPVDPRAPDGPRRIRHLLELLEELLGLTPDLFDAEDALPEDLACYVPEGGQTIRPTLALRRLHPPEEEDGTDPESRADTPAARAGRSYLLLVWELPDALDLDTPETATGPWEYAPARKFDRLLRHTRVPLGLLTNRRTLRIVYAPHGESSGSIDFRVDDMTDPGGRPLLSAFVMLLSAQRFFGVQPDHQLPALVRTSRKRQAEVTEELAGQVLEALDLLLRGFETAAHRERESSPNGLAALDEALRREDDHVYGGLLTVLLRLVFLLYAEDRGLLPVGHDLYDRYFSVFGLFEQLREDQGRYPDSMDQRFGAWGRLLALFRAVYEGGHHGNFHLPQRHGPLFDPSAYPFLEGRPPGTGGSFPRKLEERAEVRIPAVDDGTVYRVLERLVILEGQRLSYQTLDVEQIGSVYEALMGYHVVKVHSPAVRLGKNRFWVAVSELLERTPARRAKWLQEVTGLQKSQARELAKEVKAALEGEGEGEARVLAVLQGAAGREPQTAEAGRLLIQPGAERRRTSSHYTPRSLSAPIVRRTLEPLLAALGPEPSSEKLLSLKVCDPAMGSGAFLAEACRFLADRVVEAWEREGARKQVAQAHDDPVVHARRLVAQRCLYGVDKNPFAVELAKLSLWLLTLAEDLPFTFLDPNLRHGDSLVGVSLEQVRGFHWKPDAQDHLASRALDEAVEQAVGRRREILALAEDDSEDAQRRKEWLLEEADDALRKARLLGDLVVGAFFAETTKTARGKELGRRLTLVHEWLEKDDIDIYQTLVGLQEEIRERVPVFHWMLELPEVFLQNRPDPLAGGSTEGKAWMDGFVGNPPFAGKNGILSANGKEYLDWLQTVHKGAHGNADLSAHFFRRTAGLLGDHGTVGLIATNTIAQGDTRATALQPLVGEGLEIYDATTDLPWPGTGAAVTVSVVHLAKGSPTGPAKRPRLLGKEVEVINSRLRPKPERPDPARLKSNEGLSFQGSIVLGTGFLLSPEERDELVEKDPRNAERIFPYIGGAEVNRNPDQSFDRYVISFDSMSLEEAEEWPDLIEIVRAKVKPERDRLKNNPDARRRKRLWWRFGRETPALVKSISRLHQCLVNSQVSKHLLFASLPAQWVYSHALYVYPLTGGSAFSVLQSRVHEPWARLLGSTLEDRLRYSVADCFETFPFPEPGPRSMIPELEDIGERLYERRAAHMLETRQGLTTTYNRLKDPEDDDPAIAELRRLHEEMDRAVLTAYGWEDIDVPPFHDPRDEAEQRAHQTFEDEVLDRLFILNQERAEAEREAAARKKGGAGKRGRKADPAQGAFSWEPPPEDESSG